MSGHGVSINIQMQLLAAWAWAGAGRVQGCGEQLDDLFPRQAAARHLPRGRGRGGLRQPRAARPGQHGPAAAAVVVVVVTAAAVVVEISAAAGHALEAGAGDAEVGVRPHPHQGGVEAVPAPAQAHRVRAAGPGTRPRPHVCRGHVVHAPRPPHLAAPLERAHAAHTARGRGVTCVRARCLLRPRVRRDTCLLGGGGRGVPELGVELPHEQAEEEEEDGSDHGEHGEHRQQRVGGGHQEVDSLRR